VLADGVGRVTAAVEEGDAVVLGADAVEESPMLEETTPEDGGAGAPELGTTGTTEVGMAGGTTTEGAYIALSVCLTCSMFEGTPTSGGVLLRGAEAVVSTDEAGGAGGGAYEPGGVGAGLMMGVETHSVTETVTVTVTGGAHAG
jgi:hypothetical protein